LVERDNSLFIFFPYVFEKNTGMGMCIWMNTDMGTGLLGLFGLKGVLYLSFFSFSLLSNVYSIINRKKNINPPSLNFSLVLGTEHAINKSDHRYSHLHIFVHKVPHAHLCITFSINSGTFGTCNSTCSDHRLSIKYSVVLAEGTHLRAVGCVFIFVQHAAFVLFS